MIVNVSVVLLCKSADSGLMECSDDTISFQGYPFTRDRILKEARVDIPPPLRAKVWAALLNIQV